MANRWKDGYEQGKRDRERALLDIQYGYYEWACFTLQQSAEKVVKALGLALGLTLWGHSLTEMLKWIGQRIEVPRRSWITPDCWICITSPLVTRTDSPPASPRTTSRKLRPGRRFVRRIESSGSVTVISLDRDELLRRLRKAAAEALEVFPELQEVRLIGSLATGTATGTSDADLLLRVREISGNPLEVMKPYFCFFSRRLEVALDLLLAGPDFPPRAGGSIAGKHPAGPARRIGRDAGLRERG
ncbi:MAG: HEPN domain-containing protein [Thermoflexus sp.]|jgi:predicted nucleotidyltransferase|nr:HEPN domain-containing protein [Thermoflexus sp.]